MEPKRSDAIEVAEDAVAELGAALKEAGVVLPSLGVDVLAYVEHELVLVELGRCNVATARALAAALRKAQK